MIQHLNEAPTNPRRVVILGASGFVGRALSSRLTQESIDTLGLSRSDVDLSLPGASKGLVRVIKPGDAVIVLSALTPDRGRGLGVFQSNIAMMAAVDEAIRSAHPSHIMYFSSDAVYPFGEEPVSEGSCAEPADLYGAMHLARELVVKSYTACPVVVFRPTLVYGAEDTHNSYGPNRFRRMAIGESEITIFGDGEEMRDHIYIEDVVQLVLMALRRRSRGLLNVATGTSISYAELARKVAERFDKPVGIVSQPRTNPITHRKFDVAARKAAFPDFVPMSLDEGLDQAHHLIAATST